MQQEGFELTLRRVQNELAMDPTRLDFSKENGINRIMVFEQVPENVKKQIKYINLDNNFITSIDKICEDLKQEPKDRASFPDLEFLSASANRIEILIPKINLPSCRKLILSNNLLKSIPILDTLVQLTYLDLSGNMIDSMRTNEVVRLPGSLQVMYIQRNSIKYKTSTEINQMIASFKDKLNLQEIDFSTNPFLAKLPQVKNIFANELPHIKTVNGELRQYLKTKEPMTLPNDILLQDKDFDDNDDSNVSGALCSRLQTCIDDPSKSVEKLKQMSEQVFRIMQQPQKINQFFHNDALKPREIEENMEIFLSNCFVFVQNQQAYLEDILKILAQLAIVTVAGFGRRCFEVLVELVRSGHDKKKNEMARKIILTYSVPLITQHTHLHNVPTFVMEGILRTVQERKDYSMVPLDIVKQFGDWIDQIIKTFQGSVEYLREEIYQRQVLCMKFVAEMAKEKSKNREIHKHYIEQKILTRCIILFQLLIESPFMELYITTLEVLHVAGTKSPKCAEEILNSANTAHNLIQDIEDEIKMFIFMFKKYKNSLINPETKENKDAVIFRYKKVEMLFKIYGTLCHHKKYTLSSLTSDFVVKELLLWALVPANHPYIINGLCCFIRSLLRNHDLSKGVQSGEMVKFISQKLENCVPLLSYLGGEYFTPMMQHLDPYARPTKNMSSMLNPKIHETFRNIVKIIKYFSQNAIDDTLISDVCAEVAQSLDAQERDEYLFIVINTPNDKVRLSIVQCLLTVRTQELDTKEVAKLVTLLSSYKNLGAGSTERIIACMMMILTKLIVADKAPAQNDFITVYAENFIQDAVEILQRNQERDLRDEDDENQEKVELSFAVTNFLKSLGSTERLSRYLKGISRATALKQSLLDEERYLQHIELNIEVERTYIGKWCSYLVATLFGKESLLPYEKYSDRILLRLAENLEGREEDQIEDLSGSDLRGIYNFEKIQKNAIFQQKERMQKQLNIWECMQSEIVINKKQLAYLESQHSLFYQQDLAVGLLQYLLGRNQSTRTMKFKDSFIQMFGNKLAFENLTSDIQTTIDNWISDFNTFMKKGKETGEKPRLVFEGRKQALDNILKEVPMPTDPLRGLRKQKPYFNANRVILFPVKTQSTANALDRDSILYGNVKQLVDPNQRAITVCVYLRVVYALLGYGIQGSGIKVARQLSTKSSYIKELTLLCEWADWRQGHIAVKYLKIVNYILQWSELCKEKGFMNGHYVISYALRQILEILSIKLSTVDQIELTYEDKVLIKEASECMYLVIDRIGTISYTDQIKTIIENNREFSEYKEKKEEVIDLVDKRIDEYILSSIMPSNSFKIFIEITIWDMQTERLLEEKNVKNEIDFKLKESMREYLIKLIATYISKCRSSKSEILQQFNHWEVFEGKYIRQTFIQDVLDEQLFNDYTEIVVEQLQAEISKKLQSEEEIKIEFSQRCFFQYKKDTLPVYLLVSEDKTFYIIHIVENIVKKKPTGAPKSKLSFEQSQQLKFKTFNIILKLDLEQINGFYQMDTNKQSQRAVMLFCKQGAFALDEKSVETGIFIFAKQFSLENFKDYIKSLSGGGNNDSKLDQETHKKYWDQDIISNDCLRRKHPQHLELWWVSLNPQKPILDRLNEFIRNRVLIINDGKNIYVYKEDPMYWYYSYSENKTPLLQTILNKSILQMNTDQERMEECLKKYFQVQAEYALDKLNYIAIDQSLNIIMELTFGAESLKIYFGSDTAREQFKHSLMRSVHITDFNPAIKQKK